MKEQSQKAESTDERISQLQLELKRFGTINSVDNHTKRIGNI